MVSGLVSVEATPNETVIVTAQGRLTLPGRIIFGGPWERFGLYDRYLVVRGDGAVKEIPAHSGELVPGSTEDLVHALKAFDLASGVPACPMTLELDPTWECASVDCGGHCFSKAYRALAPRSSLSRPAMESILREFAEAGGRIVRFDGGGDPLLHPDVRSGLLPELAASLGLKTTILTAGDLFAATDIDRIARAHCYVRVSLNAVTDETRRRFHGNNVTCNEVFAHVRDLTRASPVPVGAVFLIGHANYREVLHCALRARECGVAHFSVRRVLGPSSFRPEFTDDQLHEARELLQEVRGLHADDFRVFVPWRQLCQPDLSPASGDFRATRCWQSTFKAVAEPALRPDDLHLQLCGRYRGGGVGQVMQLPPLDVSREGPGWIERWRASFERYVHSREELPRICVSCIDRGFIRMVDGLIGFLENPASTDFEVLHYRSPEDETPRRD